MGIKKNLSPKQIIFLAEYLKDFNGTRAAIKAGYSERSAAESACENLRNSKIKDAVLKEFDKRGYVMQKVLAEYFKIATSDIRDYVNVDESGQITAKPFNKIPDGKTSIIKEIEENRVIKEDATGTKVTVYDKIKYKLHDKEKALDAICKIAGMFQDRLDLTTGGEKIPQAIFRVYKKGEK